MTDAALEAALVDALRPRGLRERVRTSLSGGYTCLQVLERLGPDVRATLEVGDDPLVAARRATERVQAALLGLARGGRVRRGRSTFGAELRGKGYRGVVVDTFRVA